MTINPAEFFGQPSPLKRLKKQRIITERISPSFGLEVSEETRKDPSEGVVTNTDFKLPILQSGDLISSYENIAGLCYSDDQPVCQRAARYCLTCGILTCIAHSKVDKKTGLSYCKPCYKKLVWKKIILGLLRFLASPFVEKVREPQAQNRYQRGDEC